ncbi:MAG: tRNA (guanosine(46)-N7)-methyltransferase TrmB [Bdellovibrionota bacterium]|nr:MAG: tRNA (guanosine(46)-N7)-methyltransferase TrmB [Bdellovibrionota bacterium]
MASTLRWQNPYIERCESVPERLLACMQGPPSDLEIQILRTQCAKFPRIICEGCCGSGRHLLGLAARDPQTLCIGFELRYKRAFRTIEKSLEQGLDNVLVLRTDARSMPALLPPASVAEVHINFPDPWDRKRWHKHRVLSPQFLDGVASLLREGGTFHYKTDHRECFDQAVAWLSHHPAFETSLITYDLYESPLAAANIKTEFESLFRSQSLPIMALVASRRPIID